MKMCKPVITKICVLLGNLFETSWDMYIRIADISVLLNELFKSTSKYVIGSLKMIMLIVGIVLVYDLHSSLSSKTYITPITLEPFSCKTDLRIPSILFCPKPYKNRQYGMIVNETLVSMMNLTDEEVDQFAEWKMNGNEPSNSTEILSKAQLFGYGSLDDLWKDLSDLESTTQGISYSGTDFYQCRGGSLSPSETNPEHCSATLFDHQEAIKTNRFLCPLWEKSIGVYDGKSPRRIWHTGVKSRCVFLEQGTHNMTYWIYLGFHKRHKFWLWFGDINIDKIHFFIENEGENNKASADLKMYQVENVETQKKVVCQNDLHLDGGKPYSCMNANKSIDKYWIYDRTVSYQKEKWSYLHLRLQGEHSFVLKEVEAFSPMGFVQLSVGTVDYFIGFSVFYFIALLCNQVSSSKWKLRLLVFLLKFFCFLILLIASVYLFIAEWNQVLSEWYTISFNVEHQSQLRLPSIGIARSRNHKLIHGGTRTLYNHTKLIQHNISFPLMEYIKLVSRVHTFSYPYPKPPVATRKLCSNSTDERERYCSFESIKDFATLVYSPHDSHILSRTLKNLEAGYGERYTAAKNYNTLIDALHFEYTSFTKSIYMHGETPQKVEEYLMFDMCQIIVSCKVGGETIPSCCEFWSHGTAFGDEAYMLRNDGRINGVIQYQTKSGRENGWKILINGSKIIDHDSGWHGSLKYGSISIDEDQDVDFMSIATSHLFYGRLLEFPGVDIKSSSLTKSGLKIDIGLISSLSNELLKDEILDDSCVPMELMSRSYIDQGKDNYCRPNYLYLQMVLIESCGCRLCYTHFDREIFHDTVCCTELQVAMCVTGPNAYRPHCWKLDQEPPFQNEFLFGSSDVAMGTANWIQSWCNFKEWKSKDNASDLILEKDKLLNMNKMLGYNVYRQTLNVLQCPKYCTIEQAVESGQSISMNNELPTGLIEVDIYYISLLQKETNEEVTFQPFSLLALFFGVWSCFFNEPLVMVIVAIAALLEAMFQLVTCRRSFCSLFAPPSQIAEAVRKHSTFAAILPSLNDGSKVYITAEEHEPTPSGTEIHSDNVKNLDVPRSAAKSDLVEAHPALVPEKKINNLMLQELDRKLEYDAEPIYDEKKLTTTPNGNVEQKTVGDTKNETQTVKKAGTSSKKNIVLGVLLILNLGLLVTALWFYSREMITGKYANIMSVSTTNSFPHPSIGLCVRKPKDIRKIFETMNTACYINQKTLDCSKHFFIFYQEEKFSCLFNYNANTNANDLTEGNSVWKLEVHSGMGNWTETIHVLMGDIMNMKFLDASIIWDAGTKYEVTYDASSHFQAKSVCTENDEYTAECPKCKSDVDTFCCTKNATLDTKILVPNLPRLVGEVHRAPACQYFIYLVVKQQKSFGYKTNLTKGYLQISNRGPLLTTYQTNDGFTPRSIFILFTTYWGMFTGITAYQLLACIVYFIVKFGKKFIAK